MTSSEDYATSYNLVFTVRCQQSLSRRFVKRIMTTPQGSTTLPVCSIVHQCWIKSPHHSSRLLLVSAPPPTNQSTSKNDNNIQHLLPQPKISKTTQLPSGPLKKLPQWRTSQTSPTASNTWALRRRSRSTITMSCRSSTPSSTCYQSRSPSRRC